MGLSNTWISWKSIAEKMLSLCPKSKSKIIEADLGWSDKPMLYSEKIEVFNLVFDSQSLIDEHIQYWIDRV